MHKTLVKLENLLNELGASDLLSQVRLTAMVTLRVENVFLSDEKRRPDAYAAWIWGKTSYLRERTPEARTDVRYTGVTSIITRAQKALPW